MEEVIDRQFIQDKAIEAWVKNDCIGTALMPTGTGKSFVAIKAIFIILELKNRNNPIGKLKVLHLAERERRANGFKEQVLKFLNTINIDSDEFYNRVDITYACYQGYNNLANSEYHLIICDEIHEALTPAYSKVFTTIKRKALLGLTATVPHNKYDTGITDYNNNPIYISKFNLLQKYCKIVYNYSFKESIKNNTSRTSDLYFIKCRLTEIERVKYDNLSESIQLRYGTTKAVMLANSRASLVNNAKGKIETAEYITQTLNKLKIKSILFGTDIPALQAVLQDKIIIGTAKKRNGLMLEKFNKGHFHVIGSYKMLKQGENIENLDVCIFLSSNRKNLELDTKQRVGRLRLNDKKGIVVVLYLENTFEEQYLTKIPAILNNNNFEIIEISDLDGKLKNFSSI